MNHDYGPMLSRARTEELMQPHKESLPNDGEIYGDDLQSLMGAGWDGDWLMGAVLAGYVTHLRDVTLAIESHHLFTLDEARAEGSTRTAENLADGYRELLRVIGGLLIEAEEEAKNDG